MLVLIFLLESTGSSFAYVSIVFRDSSVGIVTKLRDGRLIKRGFIHGQDRTFIYSESFQTKTSCSADNRGHFRAE